jgi:hypothetical protein
LLEPFLVEKYRNVKDFLRRPCAARRTSPAVYPSRRNSLLLKQQKRRRGSESDRFGDFPLFLIRFRKVFATSGTQPHSKENSIRFAAHLFYCAVSRSGLRLSRNEAITQKDRF